MIARSTSTFLSLIFVERVGDHVPLPVRVDDRDGADFNFVAADLRRAQELMPSIAPNLLRSSKFCTSTISIPSMPSRPVFIASFDVQAPVLPLQDRETEILVFAFDVKCESSFSPVFQPSGSVKSTLSHFQCHVVQPFSSIEMSR